MILCFFGLGFKILGGKIIMSNFCLISWLCVQKVSTSISNQIHVDNANNSN